jgi:hypothetical protein
MMQALNFALSKEKEFVLAHKDKTNETHPALDLFDFFV